MEPAINQSELPTSERPSSSVSASGCDSFDFKSLCFYCGNICDSRRNRHLIRIVQKEAYKDRVINAANRRTDQLGKDVLLRLGQIASLVKEGARYHIKCSNHFLQIVQAERTKSPATTLNSAAFQKVCDYIEQSQKFEFTLAELTKQMEDHCLSNTLLYNKLRNKYGSDVYIQHERGKSTIIRYKYYDFGDLCKKYYRGEDLLEPEKQTVLNVAAELLKKDIKNHDYSNDSYPPGIDILKDVENDTPESILTFLGKLLEGEQREHADNFKMRRSTIAHAIISSVRRQTFISTLQLAVGTYIYRKTGSKQVIDLLNRMGICVSYYHLVQFETSIVLNPPKIKIEEGVHVQHVFDNTDHNVNTLDGHDTFHCLGGIAIYTPDNDVSYEGRIERVKKHNSATSAAVGAKGSIKAIPYSYLNARGLEMVTYSDTTKLALSTSVSLPSAYAVYLWAKAFNNSKLPSWSGFMEVLCEDEMPLVSRVICLPFINEPPSKLTTINTALHYALADAEKLKQKVCFVTFDQPLYHKARTIVAESQEHGKFTNVVVRLGGFHCLMSYLGAIGYIMNGSGLDSLWSTVYAPQSVKHMLSGHAYSRAIRAHILTLTALGFEICINVESDKTDEYKTFLASFLENWHTDSPQQPTIKHCRMNPTVAEMTDDLIAELNRLKNNGPTAQLWIQYFELIIIALQFIEAERLGDWKLHLQSIKKMLPIFHAAGHLSYAKSAQLYLEDMVKLETDLVDDEAYDSFAKGCFTVRRSDKTWAGVWTDMTIEQTLNRYFGTDLKHGRGVTSKVVARYLLSMPTIFSVMSSVEEYFDITTSSSEQHKDLSSSRQKRDEEDLGKFRFWINKHKPFEQRPNLISLSTGVAGGSEINCHRAIERGEVLMQTMVGKNAKDISLSMKNRVKNLESAKSSMHVGGASRIKIDTTQLFHRISVLFKGNVQKSQNAFDYELSPFPLALFDENGFMRKTSKAELYKIFKSYSLPRQMSLEAFSCNFTYIIDGGFLLHNLSWPHGSTYRDLFERYRTHIISHYRGSAYVVFDGYSSDCIGTKSYERYRRNEKSFAADIEISEHNLVTMKQAKFFSNTANKFQFVKLLTAYLIEKGIQVKVAEEDADTLIVKTAMEVNHLFDGPVAVVGNDTDVLVLLIALSDDRKPIFFKKITPKNITLYCTVDNNNLREFLLFAHAFVGCDTTSSLYGKGKKKLISRLEKNEELRQLCQVFYNPDSSVAQLLEAAKKIIFDLYAIEDNTISLGLARYTKYETSTISNTTVMRLSSLPPTAAALEEHVKRVYFQMQTWLGRMLRPEDWGWQRTAILLLPIMTQQNLAPDELLNVVSCGCTTNCSNSRCKCKKSGISCSRYCKNCSGISCTNIQQVRIDSLEDNDFDSYDEEDIQENQDDTE